MRRTPLPLVVALAAALLVARPSVAETPGDAGATPIRGTRVFEAFHGRAGIQRIVHDLYDRVQVDRRIEDIFKATDRDKVETKLSDQICFIVGGDCVYTGKNMTEAHKDVGLQEADFNALVEDLQWAMDREHVPFSAQNALLAKLAPMERVVVVR